MIIGGASMSAAGVAFVRCSKQDPRKVHCSVRGTYLRISVTAVALPTTTAMAHSPSATNSNSRYQSIINQALQEYKNTTGKDLPSHPLFRDLTACNSAGAILGVLQRQLPGYDAPGSSQESSKWPWLGTTVDALIPVLKTIGSGVGTVSL
jgi:hypothetical protein